MVGILATIWGSALQWSGVRTFGSLLYGLIHWVECFKWVRFGLVRRWYGVLRMSDWGAEAVFNVTSSLSLGLNVNSRWDRRRWLRKQTAQLVGEGVMQPSSFSLAQIMCGWNWNHVVMQFMSMRGSWWGFAQDCSVQFSPAGLSDLISVQNEIRTAAKGSKEGTWIID